MCQRYNITNVVNVLINDIDMTYKRQQGVLKKFTLVEMAFFQMWWNEQNDTMKLNVKKLVKDKRLQFVNAGISMSDEADVHYEDFINNMKAGHDFLFKELQYKPTVGWQIDPFGHHSATGALFAEMGFEAVVFCRIDYQDKDLRKQKAEMEFVWRPFNKSYGSRAEIFTHLTHNHYGAPKEIKFSESKDEPQVIDNPKARGYNVK